MRVIIKPKRGLGRIEVELPSKLAERIKRLSERYNVGEGRILEIVLSGSFKEPEEDVERLENEVRELEKKVGKLEREWAPLRYKAYGVSEDNKILAIELNALLAENSQLKRFLRKKVERDPELRGLIQYYIR
ncbi:hypothetical protein [Thermococcus sp. 2319x1]|uniref:hypothetical protein n=1 Tax=Thermococcus sp. 2319x1 TaxID=1674923 RepID=UPI001582A0C1|nr:hypothetical protein [Thermococcus sp. 2319x1]